MNRRNLIKSLAILGAGASVPLFAAADDSAPLELARHPRKRNRFMPPADLSEAALEDLLVEMGERNARVFTDPIDWFIS